MRGIYEISIDKYVYIGQAEVIERRQREHLRDLSAGRHDNGFMQRAFDKHGLNPDGWFRVLELVPSNEALTPRELFWYKTRATELGRQRVMNIVEPGDNPVNAPGVRERITQSAIAATQRQDWQDNFRRGMARRAQDERWLANNAAARAAEGKRYVFVSPESQRVEIINLNKFCRENGLDQANMAAVSRGKKKQCKGWTRYEEATND